MQNLEIIRKPIVIIVGIIVVIGGFMFLTPQSGAEVPTAFGKFNVIISAIDAKGDRHMMEEDNIRAQLLQWTHAGVDITKIDVEIRVTATGSGFDHCEFDFSTVHPQLVYTISSDSATHTFPQDSYSVPLDQETKIWEDTLDLTSELIPGSNNLYSLDIDFLADGISFRGVTGGGVTIELPITATSESAWIETWDDPVYMKDFHWDQDDRADVHMKYLDSSGDWIEFDGHVGSNGWLSAGSYTRSINADTYGIRVGGWTSTHTTTFEWDWYTDSSGTQKTSVVTGSENSDYGPWQETDASFSVGTDLELTWVDEAYCGDGNCDQDEDCQSCPEDCGSCDTWIEGFNLVFDGDFIKDVCSPRMHAYTGSSWEDWRYYHRTSDCSLLRLTFPRDIYYGESVAFEYYVKPGHYGDTLYGEMRLYGPSGQCVSLDYTSWSSIDANGVTTSSSGGPYGDGWYNLGAWAPSGSGIDEPGAWDLEIFISYSGPIDEAPNINIDSLPPLIDPTSEYAYVKYTTTDPDSSSVDTTVEWGGDGTDSFNNENTGTQYYREHQVSQTYATTQTGMTVTVTATDPTGLSDSDSKWISFWTNMQFVTTGLFSITNHNTNYQPYVVGDRYLGEI